MDIKRFIPHASAILIFVVITCIFFSPLFHDKQIVQGDVTHFQGMSKEITDYREKTGKEPLWTNSMFGGMPAYQISVQYPNNLVQYLQNFLYKVLPSPIILILICMIGFYFLLITMKVDPWLSIAGGIAFGLSSFFVIVIQAGHNTEVLAIGYMAPVLMGILITMRGRLFLGGSLTALALALELNSNHLQITYYLMMAVIIIAIGEAIRLFISGKKDYLVKAAGILGVAAVLAVLPNMSNLLLTNEYGKASTRGQSEITVDNKEQKKTTGLPIEYATQWSYGKSETMTLLIPDFSGGASEAISTYNEKALDGVDDKFKEYIGGQSAYFGDVIFTSGPVYVGAIICFLFILGLFIVKDQIKWWILTATILSIMLAWGRNLMGFTEFFFHYLPGYNKFRSVEMILVIAELMIPLLAMLALREIIINPSIGKEKWNNWYLTAFKKFADFKGRSGRSEYWYFVLFNTIIASALALMEMGLVQTVYSLAVLIPSLALGFRRMHDVNKSGWFMFIPVYNIILACTKGTTGENQYGADPLEENTGEKVSTQALIITSFVATAGLALLVYLTPTTFVTPVKDSETKRITQDVLSQKGTQQVADEVLSNLETARLEIVKSDAIRSFLFILLGAGLVFFYVRKPFGVLPLAGGLTLLMLVDMWGVSHRYMGDDNYEKVRKTSASFKKSAADELILKDPSPDYRVLNLAASEWQDASTSYFHKSIGGYHGAKLKRIQELYEQVMEAQIGNLRTSMQMQISDSMMNEVLPHLSTLNMLNA
ncbi:MAG TPA: DUF805 domain-containing protein, partial [Bacteroidia bacterium]|nr:DUF805 domain-containing protein [Bacteroidia bacterium]